VVNASRSLSSRQPAIADRLARSSDRATTSSGEHNGKSDRTAIRRRFVPALIEVLSARHADLPAVIHSRLGFLNEIIILQQEHKSMAPPSVHVLTPRTGIAAFVFSVIQHVVRLRDRRARCCGEQNLNRVESVIRRRFVPDSFQPLTPQHSAWVGSDNSCKGRGLAIRHPRRLRTKPPVPISGPPSQKGCRPSR
jgi:hypothetical protein